VTWDDVLALWEEPWVRGAVALIAGTFVALAVGSLLSRRLRRAGMPHRAMVFSKVVTYVGVVLAVVMAASAAGVEIDKMLATAGVLTIAVGLAAQTSLSNVIAGLFLLLDRPFQVGDSVEIEARGGTIERISLLSTYLRTWDNLLVRWPNEVVMKATILNYVGYPARRVDTKVGVAYGSDIAHARDVIAEAVGALPSVLLDPAPQVLAIQFLDSAIEIQARVWVPRTEFLEARSRIVETIHDALAAAGIEIPFPQRTVWHRGAAPVGGGEDDDA
jgi:small-conductance mechanosensitive channel